MIGHYKQSIGSGMFCKLPVYGTRNQFLPLVGRTMFQVQIMYLGSLVWINTDEENFIGA